MKDQASPDTAVTEPPTASAAPGAPAVEAPPAPQPGLPAEPADDGIAARELGSILDEALDRMERRATGDERPIPLPWSNVAAALGGGFWGGTLTTLIGDTGSGKTQWALQAAVHAAEYGIPVCYVGSESGHDQLAARLLALKSAHRWSDLYVGRTDKETLETLRMGYAQAMKALPFHIVSGPFDRERPPEVRRIAEDMRRRYPEARAGSRPFLLVLDFVNLAGTTSRDDIRDMMGRVAREARQSARDEHAAVLFVSTTSRETRTDETIGIHRERRQPARLGRGNPARLVISGKEDGDVERESDTILVLAQEPPRPARLTRSWTRVWCAVAKNRAGARAWCALRFNGSSFEVDLDTPPLGEPGLEEEDRNRSDEEE